MSRGVERSIKDRRFFQVKLTKKELECLTALLKYQKSINDGYDNDTKYIISGLSKLLKQRRVK